MLSNRFTAERASPLVDIVAGTVKLGNFTVV